MVGQLAINAAMAPVLLQDVLTRYEIESIYIEIEQKKKKQKVLSHSLTFTTLRLRHTQHQFRYREPCSRHLSSCIGDFAIRCMAVRRQSSRVVACGESGRLADRANHRYELLVYLPANHVCSFRESEYTNSCRSNPRRRLALKLQTRQAKCTQLTAATGILGNVRKITLRREDIISMGTRFVPVWHIKPKPKALILCAKPSCMQCLTTRRISLYLHVSVSPD
jgi:hypothetical protein